MSYASSLLYDVNNGGRKRREQKKHFFANILAYNTHFSFASTQYTHKPVAHLGVPVKKVEGSVRHFTSAVYPGNPNALNYGNYYVYRGEEAVQKRLENQYIEGLDPELVRELTACLEQHHPFARFYHTMGEMMEREEANGLDPLQMRMRIVDPRDYKEGELQGHEGIYRRERSNDYVALFYSCPVEQDVLPRGLVVYPKRRQSIPMPMYHWKKEVNSLCYSLLFPRGEPGYYPKGYYRVDPKPFNEQLADYRERQLNLGYPDCSLLWEPDPDEHDLDLPVRRIRRMPGDPNLEDEVDEEEHLGNDHDDYTIYDRQFDEVSVIKRRVKVTIEFHPGVSDTTHIEFIERRGEIYPVRRTTIDEDDERMDTGTEEDNQENNNGRQDEWDSGDDEIVIDGQPSLSADSQPVMEEGEHPIINDLEEDQDSESDDDEQIQERDGELNDLEHIIEGHRTRQFVSLREWALYVNQDRKRFTNRITASGKLGQLFVIDLFTRVQQSQMSMVRLHHTQYLTSTRKALLESLQMVADRHNRKIGCVTCIPSTVPGSPRYLHKKYEEAVAMANHLGTPDLFITFTAATNWPDIQDHIPAGHTWADHPFLLNEVFKKKMEDLLEMVVGEPVSKGAHLRNPGMFGRVRWYTYSIEFQQRGPPHMHLIVSLVKHIRTTQQIDAVCSAELPVVPDDPNDPLYEGTKKLRELVEEFMIHTPCENNPDSYCNVGKKPFWKTCKKYFPKEFSNATEFGDRDYPALKRPENGQFVMKWTPKGPVKADNRHVVAYNIDLLMTFESHINVQVISTLKVLKYIFKYLFKGFDRALVECVEGVGIDATGSYGVTGQMTMTGRIMHPRNMKLPAGVIKERLRDAQDVLAKHGVPLRDEQGQEMVVYDETRFFEDMRAVTAPEAAWEIAEFHRTGSSHTIITTYVHSPFEEPVSMDIDIDEEGRRELAQRTPRSRLTAWFALNGGVGPDAEFARQLTYEQLPLHFLYKNGVWRKRLRDWSRFMIGTIKFVQPRYLEQFAIRLLCQHQKGVTSFEELRTINGTVYEDFVNAARALRLMNSEIEWDMCLAEAQSSQKPDTLRRLFVSILIYCAPANPLELWEHHKESFMSEKHWTIERKTAHALFHIQSGLRAHGMELNDFKLPEVKTNMLPTMEELDVDDSSKEVRTKELCEKEGQRLEQVKTAHFTHIYQMLTPEQAKIVKQIVKSVKDNKSQSFFIEGSGGCGKTFVYHTIYNILSGLGLKVLCVAHTGVAASLLPYGQTAHRAFSIPLTTEEDMVCKINLQSTQANDLRQVACVLWDEAPMTDRRIFSAVDGIFRQLKVDVMLGGVPLIFGGDWRQTLPIVQGISGPGIIDYALRSSFIWSHLKVLHLTKNLRAIGDTAYANWIKEIGEGQDSETDFYDVELPEEMLVNSERALINKIFGGEKIKDNNITDHSAILTVDNESSLDINNKVLRMVEGDEHEMVSRDEFDPERGFKAIQPEIYNMITPAGMPPHKLTIKLCYKIY